MRKITPFLWFDGKAEEAMNFYVSIFKNSKIGRVTPGPKGTVMSATFQLDGQEFMALNAGPQFKFTEAISFYVNCETQEEVDELWEKLSEGGQKSRCGWLKDKFGLSWQIIPSALGQMLQDKDPGKSKRVMQAMLQMGKIEIAKLKQAYDKE
jgi:predicted 3-demethylubiquinone-9 3-methyltransferase (glyoxalase superfamily)